MKKSETETVGVSLKLPRICVITKSREVLRLLPTFAGVFRGLQKINLYAP